MILGALGVGMAAGAASVILALVAGTDLVRALLLYPLVGAVVTLAGALGAASIRMAFAPPQPARATAHAANLCDHARTPEMR
jgi:hypothetical protein